MAEVLENYTLRGRGMKGQYGRYMDGRVWHINEGDHNAGPLSVRSAIASLARSIGKATKTHYPAGVGKFPVIVQVVDK